MGEGGVGDSNETYQLSMVPSELDKERVSCHCQAHFKLKANFKLKGEP